MTDTTDINGLKKVMNAASLALWDVKKAMREERDTRLAELTSALDAELEAKFGPAISAASKAEAAATEAYQNALVREAESKAAAVPDGVLVEWAWEATHRFAANYQWRLTGRRGIKEVFTPQSQFPINRAWGAPKVGDIVVRLLKKGGKPALNIAEYAEPRIDKYGSRRSGWLPEGQEPPCAE